MRRAAMDVFLFGIVAATMVGINAAAAGCPNMGSLHVLLGMDRSPCAAAGFAHHVEVLVAAFTAVIVVALVFVHRQVTAPVFAASSGNSRVLLARLIAQGRFWPRHAPRSLTQTLFRKGILHRREVPADML